jgi:hypothetical protein
MPEIRNWKWSDAPCHQRDGTGPASMALRNSGELDMPETWRTKTDQQLNVDAAMKQRATERWENEGGDIPIDTPTFQERP